jgi:hypothetical protein
MKPIGEIAYAVGFLYGATDLALEECGLVSEVTCQIRDFCSYGYNAGVREGSRISAPQVLSSTERTDLTNHYKKILQENRGESDWDEGRRVNRSRTYQSDPG